MPMSKPSYKNLRNMKIDSENIPAAVFIGFILGIWTKSSSQTDAPLTALVDTVYIKVPTPQPQQEVAILFC